MKIFLIIFINFMLSVALLLSFVYEYSKDHEKIIKRIFFLEKRVELIVDAVESHDRCINIFHKINTNDVIKTDAMLFMFDDLDKRLIQIESMI